MVSDTQLYKRHKHIMHVGTAIIIEIYATILGSSLFAGGAITIALRAMFFPMVIFSPIPFSTREMRISIIFPTSNEYKLE